MKKDTLMGVWDHLVSAEALAKGIHHTLSQKENDSPEVAQDISRVGQGIVRISRARRDWEYWFVAPLDVSSKKELTQLSLSEDKRLYTE